MLLDAENEVAVLKKNKEKIEEKKLLGEDKAMGHRVGRMEKRKVG